ncbi:hypothetical protein [Erythrobacter sp. MTPC3]|uniref:hypothetical protein n=1 Tax=Erythrobacter sp. MTPC3 TaxID=3056564 RepID=UPI0036F3FF58
MPRLKPVTPLRKRLLAAVIIVVFAIGSVLFRNNGNFDLASFGLNLILGSIGFLFLHHRWKKREARTITPEKARDIFS